MRGSRTLKAGAVAAGALGVLAALDLALSVLTSAPPYAPAVVAEADRERARAYLAANLAPLPEGWAWTEVRGEDARLRMGHAGLADAPAIILVVPGYTSTAELYAETYADWRAAGYGVAALDLPGQGGSQRRSDDPEKPWADPRGGNVMHAYGRAVRDGARALAAMTDAPIVLVGESLGGHAALRAAADHELPISALVLEVPGIEAVLPRGTEAVTGLLARLGHRDAYGPGQGRWARTVWDAPYDAARCGDRDERRFMLGAMYAVDPGLRVGGASNGWVQDFQASGRQLREPGALDRVTVPVLTILAGRDVIVENDAAREACAALADCRAVTIEEATHCLPAEDEAVRAEAARLVAEAARRVRG